MAKSMTLAQKIMAARARLQTEMPRLVAAMTNGQISADDALAVIEKERYPIACMMSPIEIVRAEAAVLDYAFTAGWKYTRGETA